MPVRLSLLPTPVGACASTKLPRCLSCLLPLVLIPPLSSHILSMPMPPPLLVHWCLCRRWDSPNWVHLLPSGFILACCWLLRFPFPPVPLLPPSATTHASFLLVEVYPLTLDLYSSTPCHQIRISTFLYHRIHHLWGLWWVLAMVMVMIIEPSLKIQCIFNYFIDYLFS